MLLREAAREYKWKLNMPAIALMWRGGCIIRSVFLADITKAFRNNPELENLLFDDFFKAAIAKAQPGWRRSVVRGIEWGIPTPCFSTALSFFDGYRTKKVPANLLQAQRDYFGEYLRNILSQVEKVPLANASIGAHTFRVDPEHASETLPVDKDIHINWTGRGGNVSASTYDA